MRVAERDQAGRRPAAQRPPLGADGLVAGAPGARDWPLAMTPGTEGGARRTGDLAGAWADRVEEQGPFLAPAVTQPPRPDPNTADSDQV